MNSTNDTIRMCPRKRVLIVDDNPINLAVLEEMLPDHELRCLTQATRAVETAARFRPHVVLMDYYMPHNGVETARAIRRTSGLENTPIVFVTAGGMEGLAEALDELSAAYLRKPFEESVLRELLGTIADSSQEPHPWTELEESTC